MDGVELLLRQKYCPDTIPDTLPATPSTTSAESLQASAGGGSNKPMPTYSFISKAVQGGSEGLGDAANSIAANKTMLVLMNSLEFDEDLIWKCCVAHNRQYPADASRSFTLPVAINDIPANSWIFVIDNVEGGV